MCGVGVGVGVAAGWDGPGLVSGDVVVVMALALMDVLGRSGWAQQGC